MEKSSQLYTKNLTMKRTPVPIWDEAAEQSYKNLLEWIDEEEIRNGLEGNFCRCTGYHNIIKSVKAAADSMKGGA